MPFSLDLDITDGPISFLSEKGRDKGLRKQERRSEREGMRWKAPFKGVFVHLFRFLEQAGSHRTPRGPGNVSIRNSTERERKKRKKRTRGGKKERRNEVRSMNRPLKRAQAFNRRR